MNNFEEVEKWLNIEFESSCSTTDQFRSFIRDVKKCIKNELKGYKIDFNMGHFYFSGFAENLTTGKFAYFSSDDVRGCNNWFDGLLVRTAKHNKDFTGGSNGFTGLKEIKTIVDRLTV